MSRGGKSSQGEFRPPERSLEEGTFVKKGGEKKGLIRGIEGREEDNNIIRKKCVPFYEGT